MKQLIFWKRILQIVLSKHQLIFHTLIYIMKTSNKNIREFKK